MLSVFTNTEKCDIFKINSNKWLLQKALFLTLIDRSF